MSELATVLKQLHSFLKYIQVAGEEECWPAKKLDNSGYARIRRQGKNPLLHRLVYQRIYGPFEGIVMHKCNNPACNNPKHLLAGTVSGNALYREQCGRGGPQTRKQS